MWVQTSRLPDDARCKGDHGGDGPLGQSNLSSSFFKFSLALDLNIICHLVLPECSVVGRKVC